MKDFLIGALASAMVIGVVLVMGTAGTTDYGRLHGRVADGPLTLAGLMLVLLCLLFELGAVPAHAWMPDVAEGAPASAAAFLTVVPKIGAAVALARFVSLFPPEDGALRLLIAILSAVTITAGNLAAFRSDDVRRLLGWSSVGQSGYALMAVAVAGLSAAALPALTVFVGAYALANICAFGVVTHLRGRTDLADYAGLARNRRLVATGMILAFLSVVGIPPLAGFVGKFALIMATIDGGYGWLALFGIANSVLSLFPYARVIGPMVFAASDARPGVLGCSSGLVALVAAGALVVVGIFCGSNPADAAGDPPGPGWRQVTVRPDRQLRHRREADAPSSFRSRPALGRERTFGMIRRKGGWAFLGTEAFCTPWSGPRPRAARSSAALDQRLSSSALRQASAQVLQSSSHLRRCSCICA